MRAGGMREQLIIQTKTLTQDSELNAVETWADWLTVRAEPIDKTSREFYRMSTINSEVTEVYRIRYVSGVTAHQRIKFNNRYLEIVGDPINEGERNISLLLSCKAVV
jgi:SPP1 family predicted phage head-tail adaptor